MTNAYVTQEPQGYISYVFGMDAHKIATGSGQPGGNHALQDYQMGLMLLEQWKKKRSLMARQERLKKDIELQNVLHPSQLSPQPTQIPWPIELRN
jgi:hypothetical protein